MAREYLGGTNQEGYWVSPKNIVYPTSPYRHIDMVIANPEQFDLERKFVQDKYLEHGEFIGREGDARDEIMTHLLKKGWIKVRARQNFVSVQIWDFDYRDIENLETFARKGNREGYNGLYIHPNQQFRVMSLKRERIQELTFKELTTGNLFECCGVPSLSEYINTVKQ